MARGLSQTELANMANIAPGQVNRYEAGVNHPRPHILVRIAGSLGVHPTWLDKGTGPRETGSTTSFGDEIDVTTTPVDGGLDIAVDMNDAMATLFTAQAEAAGMPLDAFIKKLLLDRARQLRDARSKGGAETLPTLEVHADQLVPQASQVVTFSVTEQLGQSAAALTKAIGEMESLQQLATLNYRLQRTTVKGDILKGRISTAWDALQKAIRDGTEEDRQSHRAVYAALEAEYSKLKEQAESLQKQISEIHFERKVAGLKELRDVEEISASVRSGWSDAAKPTPPSSK